MIGCICDLAIDKFCPQGVLWDSQHAPAGSLWYLWESTGGLNFFPTPIKKGREQNSRPLPFSRNSHPVPTSHYEILTYFSAGRIVIAATTNSTGKSINITIFFN